MPVCGELFWIHSLLHFSLHKEPLLLLVTILYLEARKQNQGESLLTFSNLKLKSTSCLLSPTKLQAQCLRKCPQEPPAM